MARGGRLPVSSRLVQCRRAKVSTEIFSKEIHIAVQRMAYCIYSAIDFITDIVFALRDGAVFALWEVEICVYGNGLSEQRIVFFKKF